MDSTNSVTQIKSELRKRFRAEREFLVVDSSWEHLLDDSEVKKALVVASYFSYGDEPNTHDLNQALIHLGKNYSCRDYEMIKISIGLSGVEEMKISSPEL